MKKILIFSCIIGISCGQKPPTLTSDQIEQIRQAEIPLNNAKAARDSAQAEPECAGSLSTIHHRQDGYSQRLHGR